MHRRLDVRAPASVAYLRTLASAQRTLAGDDPGARSRPRASAGTTASSLNGVAVVVPRRRSSPRCARIPGATVWPSVTYHALLNRTPAADRRATVWGPTLATAGNGMKIGIIDDGLDQTHPYFSTRPASRIPPASRRGRRTYTTPKVIVARAFAPPSPTWKYASTPFDPEQLGPRDARRRASPPATTTRRDAGGASAISGVAPNAYLGNYKVLTVPTPELRPRRQQRRRSPPAIEAAVSDGMDVINLSLGEPEVEPTRDIVVAGDRRRRRRRASSRSIAAGNDFGDFGYGSVGSPGNAPSAITVAAVERRTATT